jgi:hypothetical protein
MTGYHEVRIFPFADFTDSMLLPDGWKPFAVKWSPDKKRMLVIARRWHRAK